MFSMILGMLGCAYHPALPPPTQLTANAVPIEEGDYVFFTGSSTMDMLMEGEFSTWPNVWGGLFLVGWRYGLSDALEVQLSIGPVLSGGTVETRLAMNLWESERFSFGATAGIATSPFRGYDSVWTNLGTGLPDDEEERWEVVGGLYQSVTPSVGGRALYSYSDKVNIVGQLRGSYGHTFTWAGLKANDTAKWLESNIGFTVGSPVSGQVALGLHGTLWFIRDEIQFYANREISASFGKSF